MLDEFYASLFRGIPVKVMMYAFLAWLPACPPTQSFYGHLLMLTAYLQNVSWAKQGSLSIMKRLLPQPTNQPQARCTVSAPIIWLGTVSLNNPSSSASHTFDITSARRRATSWQSVWETEKRGGE